MRLILAIVLVLLFALLLSASASAQLTVFLAGDSTAANKAADRRPETGWGEMLQQHFDPAKVKIDNRVKWTKHEILRR